MQAVLAVGLLAIPTVAQQTPSKPSEALLGKLDGKRPGVDADIALFGGYLGSLAPPTINCNVSRGSTLMTCAGGVNDFAVGQGVSIPGAGPPPTVKTPSAATAVTAMVITGNTPSNNVTVTLASSVSFKNATSIVASKMADATLDGTYTNVHMVDYIHFTATFKHSDCNPCSFGRGVFTASVTGVVTPQGQSGGSTIWNYRVVARDNSSLGFSAASATFLTRAGAAQLGINTYTITPNGCVTNKGQTVITTTAPHHVPNSANYQFNVLGGTTGTGSMEGAFVTVSTTPTTITMNTQGIPNGTYCPSGGTLNVIAQNEVQWLPQSGLTAGYLVYRSKGVGPYSLVGITQGQDSSFFDQGLAAPMLDEADAAYIPSIPSASPINGILATTIKSIAGTTVTLATVAGASLSHATVLHDDAEPVLAACNSFGTGGAGIYIPGPNGAVFNSLLNLNKCTANQIRITSGAALSVNEPIVLKSGTVFAGDPKGSFSGFAPFASNFQTYVQVEGYPGFLLGGTTGFGGVATVFKDLAIGVFRSYQSAIYLDTDPFGDGIVDITLVNTNVGGHVGSQPLHIGGGFGLYVTSSVFSIEGATAWGYLPPILNRVNCGLGQNSLSLSGIWDWRDVTVAGGSIAFDTCGNSPLGANLSNMLFTSLLSEGSFYPLFDFSKVEPGNIPGGITITYPSYSDPQAGSGTPLIETGNSNVAGLRVFGQAYNTCGNGNQPLFAGSARQSAEVDSIGCAILGLANVVSTGSSGIALVNASASTSGSGQLFYAMSTPAAPVLTTNAINPLPTGTYCYSVIANDVNANSTAPSPSTCVTTTGSQGILVSWTEAKGQTSTTLCRGESLLKRACATTFAGGAPFQIGGTTYQEKAPSFVYSGTPTFGTAGSSGIGMNGLFGYKLVLPSSGFSVTESAGPLTANRTQTKPDASGPVALVIFGSLTTTAAASDNVRLVGMTPAGHCSLTATNALAAANIVTTYVSAKTTNQITITHAAISGLTFDLACAPY